MGYTPLTLKEKLTYGTIETMALGINIAIFAGAIHGNLACQITVAFVVTCWTFIGAWLFGAYRAET